MFRKITSVLLALLLLLNAAALVQLPADDGVLAVAADTETATASAATSVKKGICASMYPNNPTQLEALNAGWYYNWGYTGTSTATMEYVPMVWGAGTVNATALAEIRSKFDTGEYRNLLTFNEPDMGWEAGGCNMTVDEAINLWPQLEALGVRLSCPAVANIYGTWLPEFMTRAEALDYQVDFLTVHCYQYYPNTAGEVAGLKSAMTYLYDTYGRPIWLTEFGAIDTTYWGTGHVSDAATQAAATSYITAACTMLESLGFVERYSWFLDDFGGGTVPTEAAYTALFSGGNLTTSGAAYAAIDSSTPLTMSYDLDETGIQVQAVGGTAPYTYTAENLPSGMTLNSTTGKITFDTLNPSVLNATITVTDAAQQYIYRPLNADELGVADAVRRNAVTPANATLTQGYADAASERTSAVVSGTVSSPFTATMTTQYGHFQTLSWTDGVTLDRVEILGTSSSGFPSEYTVKVNGTTVPAGVTQDSSGFQIQFPQAYSNVTSITVQPADGGYWQDWTITGFAAYSSVNLYALTTAIAAAEDLTASDYTTDSWATLTAALTAAQTVYANASATQAQVDAAAQALNTALAGLEETDNPPPDTTVETTPATATLIYGYDSNPAQLTRTATNGVLDSELNQPVTDQYGHFITLQFTEGISLSRLELTGTTANFDSTVEVSINGATGVNVSVTLDGNTKVLELGQTYTDVTSITIRPTTASYWQSWSITGFAAYASTASSGPVTPEQPEEPTVNTPATATVVYGYSSNAAQFTHAATNGVLISELNQPLTLQYGHFVQFQFPSAIPVKTLVLSGNSATFDTTVAVYINGEFYANCAVTVDGTTKTIDLGDAAADVTTIELRPTTANYWQNWSITAFETIA